MFSEKIEKACHKKEALFDESKLKYGLRSIFAGAFLTMSTAGGAYAADKISHVHPDLGKFMFSFLFAWGLVYILFLNAELATSNMMYLAAGTYQRHIHWKKAATILFYCTLCNLIGALLIGFLFSQSSAFSHLHLDDYVSANVVAKITKPNHIVLLDAILANVFVNVAILSFLFIENQSAKMWVVLSAVFLFVFLGEEHVIANFASFSIVKFNEIANQIPQLDWLNMFRQWSVAFIGNCIGGGLIIGVGYAYLNKSKSIYRD
ncbi:MULTISPECIES: formate/nitrite transporter family protein [unclassified Granulicatella]|uniref:formate/nitrite transporter family protein n=1 Tax=unclassified Granulicatella TaxID=2630493 RepID=UPI001073D713|nr:MULTISPECIES: formate/nitrite transporter family protein [unclassified Granulicatella]MBF0780240.1 formate/nitrite transporter family protein [Granulicatella sp. 19428wC4_WM01]TFU95674.1 formate-nitrite transporter [Granulicatella sp. WM01]